MLLIFLLAFLDWNEFEIDSVKAYYKILDFEIVISKIHHKYSQTWNEYSNKKWNTMKIRKFEKPFKTFIQQYKKILYM